MSLAYLVIAKGKVESKDVDTGVKHLTHVFRIVARWT